MSATQVFTFIVGSALVIFGAYFVTYLLARGSQKVYRGRIIQVLDRFSLSKDKYLILIAVYDKIYLVAFSGGNVTLLDNIAPEAAAAFAANSQDMHDKPRQPGDLAAMLISRLRRHSAKKTASAEPGPPFPYEAYFPMERSRPDSFWRALRSSLEKEERREEDNR